MATLIKPIKFTWDKGNEDKNLSKHGVSNKESEETFFDEKHKIFKDKLHSGSEERLELLARQKWTGCYLLFLQ